jgi:hypothetical protein
MTGTFYINRAGHNLSKTKLNKLEKTKQELGALFQSPDEM